MKSKDNILLEKNPADCMPMDVLSHSPERLFPPQEEASELSIVCPRADYSASRISRAVEDADAHLLNLNVTSEEVPSGEVVVDLRVSHRDAGAVCRSLERYGYVTFNVRGGYDRLEEVAAERIAELMAHIQV